MAGRPGVPQSPAHPQRRADLNSPVRLQQGADYPATNPNSQLAPNRMTGPQGSIAQTTPHPQGQAALNQLAQMRSGFGQPAANPNSQIAPGRPTVTQQSTGQTVPYPDTHVSSAPTADRSNGEVATPHPSDANPQAAHGPGYADLIALSSWVSTSVEGIGGRRTKRLIELSAEKGLFAPGIEKLLLKIVTSGDGQEPQAPDMGALLSAILKLHELMGRAATLVDALPFMEDEGLG